jgi:organic radical activating enzyme
MSLYWDDFERRIDETVYAVKNNAKPIIRRVAVFVTENCNFKCSYCNHKQSGKTLTESQFDSIVKKYGESAIIHITGGEPSVVKWLYPYLKKHGHEYRFNLNTNAYITPPYESVKRLKVSMDDYDEFRWNGLVGVNNAFKTVLDNIKKSLRHTTVSITYTLTRENYYNAVNFVDFAKKEFGKDLYAIFFSVYKGNNPRFMITDNDADVFFNYELPALRSSLPAESLSLLTETIDEKRRLIQGVRFPGNLSNSDCYISMTERVISPECKEYGCSHLYRDGVLIDLPYKHEKCLYGCNRRLVRFNEDVERRLRGTI